jgi:hypothetical protein
MSLKRSQSLLLNGTFALIASIAAAAPSLSAQESPMGKPMPEEKPGLLAKATITPDAARKLAIGRVPNSQISKEELEMEGGKLVYSFDLAVAGKGGIEEVLIDAKSGKVLSQEHESAKQVEAERAKEAREQAGKPAAAPKRKGPQQTGLGVKR